MKKMAAFVLCLSLMTSNLFSTHPFSVVMYDSKAESLWGAFPPKRDLWGRAITRLKELGAKAVVLKFFFDLYNEKDAELSEALKTLPTFLQARIDDSQKRPNSLPPRFAYPLEKPNHFLISGKSGWIPRRVLSANAFDVGFVDIRNINEIPMVMNYREQYVKSLWFSVMNFIFPKLRIENGFLENGTQKVPLSKELEVLVNYPKEDSLNYVSLYDLLKGEVETGYFKDKIVIVGWDGDKSSVFEVSTGRIKIHRAFIYGLFDLYERLRK